MSNAYLTSNTMIAYPFADDASGLSRDGGSGIPLDFLADVDAQRSTGLSVERKDKNFLARLPEVDRLLHRGRDLRVHTPGTRFQCNIEFFQIPL